MIIKKVNKMGYNSAIPPIETKFGLHFQSLGTLPNYEQWQQLKSYINTYSPIELLTTSIEGELKSLREHPDYALMICVPTLGFTDPAFDYDLRPWFLIPVVLNAYIAQTGVLAHSRVAEVWAVDMADNKFKLFFTKEGLLDYEKISEQANNKVIFTTFKAIHYVFSLSTLLGEGLESLPPKEKKALENSICFFPPPVTPPHYVIDLCVIDKQHHIIQKNSVILEAEIKKYFFVSHFESHYSKATLAKNKEYLNLKAGMYVEQELSFARYGYKIKLITPSHIKIGQLSAYTQAHPYHFRSGIVYVNTKQFPKNRMKLHEFVLFFGLSPVVMKQLIRIIVSKEKFFKNHLIASTQEKKNHHKFNYNNYYLYPDLLDELYEWVVDACAHKTIPLYALSESFEQSAVIFTQLINLNTSEWDSHDQWVFERLFNEQLKEVSRGYNPVEIGFNWVDAIDKVLSENATDIDIHYNIPVLSGKLNATQLVEVEVYIEDLTHSAFEQYQENNPSFILSKTLESTEFFQREGKVSGVQLSLRNRAI